MAASDKYKSTIAVNAGDIQYEHCANEDEIFLLVLAMGHRAKEVRPRIRMNQL